MSKPFKAGDTVIATVDNRWLTKDRTYIVEKIVGNFITVIDDEGTSRNYNPSQFRKPIKKESVFANAIPKFKVGDTIVCVANHQNAVNYYNITIGKEYTVLKLHGGEVTINSDSSHPCTYNHNLFKLKEEPVSNPKPTQVSEAEPKFYKGEIVTCVDNGPHSSLIIGKEYVVQDTWFDTKHGFLISVATSPNSMFYHYSQNLFVSSKQIDKDINTLTAPPKDHRTLHSNLSVIIEAKTEVKPKPPTKFCIYNGKVALETPKYYIILSTGECIDKTSVHAIVSKIEYITGTLTFTQE